MDKPGRMTGHKPVMSVGLQTVSSTTREEPFERMLPRAFNHKNAFVLMPVQQNPNPVEPKSNLTVSKSTSDEKPKASTTSRRAPVFQHLTIDTMKRRFGHSPSPSPQREDSDDMTPPTKRRRTDTLTRVPLKKPGFRPSQPLKNSSDVDSDIWQHILSFCDPKFLLEARAINSFFHQVLSKHQSIWKKSRQYHFGSDMPDCPKSLTEQQYADLLVGRGCQSNTCTRQNTVKVYWTFMGRLCTDCLARKTLRAEELAAERQHSIPNDPNDLAAGSGIPLWTALPMAASNGRRYLHARSVNEGAVQWHSDSHNGHLFLKSDYTKLEAEYVTLQQAGATDAEKFSWWQKKLSETMEFMRQVARLELWHHLRETDKRDVREERRQFFQFEAARLSPPMSAAVLNTMAAFQKALNSNNPPSARAWSTLKAKILPYRAQAEMLVKRKIARFSLDYGPLDSGPAIDRFRRLATHRSGRRQDHPTFRPEQEFVIKLGKDEFKKCLDAGVDDSDLVLLCLKNVFDQYEKRTDRPTGLNYDGTVGPYKLSMDDARMIIEEVMEEQIPRYSQQGATVFENFKCSGCVRKDYCRTWSFGRALEHILNAHSDLVGHGFEYWRLSIPFPCDHDHDKQFYRFAWYTVPWPRSLPLLPGHRSAANLPSWDPQAEVEYVQIGRTGTVSAFDGSCTRDNAAAKDDFTGNFIFAVQALDGVWLSTPCLTKIALQYALDRCVQEDHNDPPLETFMKAIPAARDANPTMDFKYKCGYCKREARVYRSARQVKYFIPIEQLHKHWVDKHNALNWTTDFLDLPSETEVLDQIVESDRQLTEDKNAVRATNAALAGSTRRRPNVKGNVILGTTLAADAFDRLFVRKSKSSQSDADDTEA